MRCGRANAARSAACGCYVGATLAERDLDVLAEIMARSQRRRGAQGVDQSPGCTRGGRNRAAKYRPVGEDRQAQFVRKRRCVWELKQIDAHDIPSAPCE